MESLRLSQAKCVCSQFKWFIQLCFLYNPFWSCLHALKYRRLMNVKHKLTWQLNGVTGSQVFWEQNASLRLEKGGGVFYILCSSSRIHVELKLVFRSVSSFQGGWPSFRTGKSPKSQHTHLQENKLQHGLIKIQDFHHLQILEWPTFCTVPECVEHERNVTGDLIDPSRLFICLKSLTLTRITLI